jgi:hypothetical protein
MELIRKHWLVRARAGGGGEEVYEMVMMNLATPTNFVRELHMGMITCCC